jgi:acetyltransferase-like isoleucine patch superfamily enzyme
MGKTKFKILKKVYIDKRAIVAKTATIGSGSKIWAFVQIGDNAKIGKNCVVGNGVYIDRNVIIGNNVKIHNKALLYNGLIIEDNCFVGPGACFTNDRYPRYNQTRNLCGVSWRVGEGASIGANATILPDVNIGKNAIVGAGSVVTKDVPPGVIVCGNPAKPIKYFQQRQKK